MHAVLRTWAAHARCLLSPEEPAVHELRRAVRQLQALVDVLDRAAPHARPVRRARKVLRQLLRCSGALRDAQVRVLNLSARGSGPRWSARIIQQARKAEREEARRCRTGFAQIPVARLGRVLGVVPEERAHSAWRLCIDHRRERLLRRINAIDPADDRSLHRARVALKRYRSVLELDARGDAGGRRHLRTLSARLGRWNDERLMLAWIAEQERTGPLPSALHPELHRRQVATDRSRGLLVRGLLRLARTLTAVDRPSERTPRRKRAQG